MHTLETKNQFIELRAQGLSLDAISAQLDVPRSTLGRWHLESIEQIQRLRAIQWHLLEEQIGHRLEDSLQRIAQRIRKWEDELDRRDPFRRPAVDVLRVIRDSRREYLQLRSLILAPLQPTRSRANCLTSLDPRKRDKTRQNHNSQAETPLPINDLQQQEPAMSHSAAVDPNPNPDAASPQSQIQNPKSEIPSSPPPLLPSSEIPTSESFDFPEPANPNPNNAPNHDSDPASQSKIANRKPQIHTGSVVFNPLECGQAIIQKCLQAETTNSLECPV